MNTVIRKIGNSEGVIIPKEILDKLGVSAGDSVVMLHDSGELRIRPIADTREEFERKMKIARERMKKYEVALRELAK
jgi:putative addiction module antidote